MALEFSGADVENVYVRGNAGASGNPEYTIEVTGNDYYEIELNTTSAFDLTVTAGSRVILWGINAIE